MQPYPRAPDLVWPRHLHGTGCLSARAMVTRFRSVVWRLCFGLGCARARVFGCAPPLLAGVMGCVCVCMRASLVARHSWPGCAVWVCVLRLGFRLRPATPGWGVGVCVWLCARSACTPPLLAALCGVGLRGLARVLAGPCHSWLGCWGVGVRVRARVSAAPCLSWLGWWAVCVLVCVLPLYPATPGWGVQCGCGCLGLGLGCAPPLLAGLCGVGVRGSARVLAARRHSWLGCWGVGVRVRARVSAAPRHSWLGCWGVSVLVCAVRLYPATPGWGVRCGCVCLGSGFGCAPPLLAGVLGCSCLCACCPRSPPLLAGLCGVGVYVLARVSVAARHSWLGCWGVYVLVWVLPLYPATPGWGVGCGCGCLGSGFGCAPPFLAGVFGCACLCACSPCTPPLLVGVCGVSVRVWVRVSAAPRHSWLGCLGVCVLVRALPLFPATPGWGVRCGCVCLGLGFGCALPLLAGVLGCVCAGVRALLVPRHSWLGCAVWVCVFGLGLRLRPATPGFGVGVCVLVCVLPLYPATPGWGARRGCVCLGLGFGCAPPLLAGVLKCVCARVRALLVPRHSWLGCAVWVCVFGLGLRLGPATPGWGVGVCVLVCVLPLYPATPGWGARRGCVCLGLGFCCAPRLLAGLLGCVCASVRAPPVPRHSWLGCVVWMCVFGLWFRLHPATPGWGVGVCVLVCVLPLYPATPGWGVRR